MNHFLSATDWLTAFIATLGGSTVLGALFRWLGKRYLDKRLAAERSLYALELERLKGTYKKHIHVYKAQFELEFKTYQEIWAGCATLMDEVARIAGLYSMTELPEGKGLKRKHAEEADAAFFAANAVIHNNEPFITIEIYDKAVQYATACKREIDAFFGAVSAEERADEDYRQGDARSEAMDEARNILEQFSDLGNCIRSRLASVSIVDA